MLKKSFYIFGEKSVCLTLHFAIVKDVSLFFFFPIMITLKHISMYKPIHKSTTGTDFRRAETKWRHCRHSAGEKYRSIQARNNDLFTKSLRCILMISYFKSQKYQTTYILSANRNFTVENFFIKSTICNRFSWN